jgi:hypothetical protein
LKFNLEKETDHKIKFLDISVYKKNSLSIDIYRKPTTIDVIIPNDSCHHKEHKMAAIRYFHNRMKIYNLSPYSYWKEKGLKAELNPIYHLLALLGAHHILHVSRIRVKRRIKSYLPFAGIIGYKNFDQ